MHCAHMRVCMCCVLFTTAYLRACVGVYKVQWSHTYHCTEPQSFQNSHSDYFSLHRSSLEQQKECKGVCGDVCTSLHAYMETEGQTSRHMNPLWLVDCLAPRTKWPSCGNYITNANVTGRSYVLMFHQNKYAEFID